MLSLIGRYKYFILIAVILMAGFDIFLIFQAKGPEPRSNMNPFSGDTIYIQPAGNVESDKLLIISRILEDNFRKGVNILPPERMKKSYYHKARVQYDASRILSWANEWIPDNAFRYIVILDDDIYSGQYNFIFGQAEMHGKACVISLARFADPARSLKEDEVPLFSKRLVSLLLHELGHTFGLKHCANEQCVMQFANSMAELDSQPIHYCTDCLARLRQIGLLDVLTEAGDAVLYLRSTSSAGERNGNTFR